MFHVVAWLLLDLLVIAAAATVTHGFKIRREYDEIRRGKRFAAFGIVCGLVALLALQLILENDAGTQMLHGFQVAGAIMLAIGVAAFTQYRDDDFPIYRVFAWSILLLFGLGGLGLTLGLRLIGQPLL